MYQSIQLIIPLVRNSISRLLLVPVVIACFGLLPTARAVVPAPDGGYPGNNTAEGLNALFFRTTGGFNTAIGTQALLHDTTGSSNTGVGVNALVFNTAGINNTAVGQGALAQNTTSNITATGFQALGHNTTGSENTAFGYLALADNTTRGFGVAVGFRALQNDIGGQNTAVGDNALQANTTGFLNTAVGDLAGDSLTTGSGNVCIGAFIFGTAGESNHTRIKNISNTPQANGQFVTIGPGGLVGVEVSSQRYKEAIVPMDKASEALLALKPVTFRYKQDLDPNHVPQYGLIAEEVEKVNPNLVFRDEEGKVCNVRYEAVNAMLLNEFLKEHRKVQDLEATVAQQQKGMELLAASLKEQASQIQKVSARLEVSKPAPQVVANH